MPFPLWMLLLFATSTTLSAGAEPRKDAYGDQLPPGAIARLGTERYRHIGHLMALAYTPDGKRIIGVSNQDGIRAWDGATGAIVQDAAIRQTLMSVAFAPDRKSMATILADQRAPLTLRVAEIETGTKLWQYEVEPPKEDRDFFDRDPVSLAYAAVGSLLSLGKATGEVVVFEAASGNVRFTASGGKAAVTALRFSPDQKILAAGDQDHAIRLWDVTSGKEMRRMEHGKAGAIGNLAFTPDGQQLVSVGMAAYGSRRGRTRSIIDGDDAARVWDVATGKQVREWHVGSDGYVSRVGLEFSPDGKTVAIHLGDSVGLWAAASGESIGVIKLIERDDAKVRVGGSWSQGLAFAPDGKTLAVTFHRTVRLFDVASRQAIHAPSGHEDRVSLLAFADDGKSLVSVSYGGDLRIWDLAKGTERAVQRTEPISALSPDGRLAAINARTDFKVVEIATNKEVVRLQAPKLRFRTAVGFTPDGMGVGIATDGGDVRTWRLPEGKLLQEKTLDVPKDNGMDHLAFSADLAKVATAGVFKDSTLYVWEVATGKNVAKIPTRGHFGFDEFTFAPDGMTLAARSFHNNWIRLCDVQTGDDVRTIEHQELGGSGELAFSPDGKLLASGGFRAFLWQTTTGKPLFRFPTSPRDGRYFSALAFSRDGKYLATAYDGGTILVWHVETMLKDDE